MSSNPLDNMEINMDMKEYLKMLESGKRLTRNICKPTDDKVKKKEDIKSD